MNGISLLLILLSVICSALAQLLFKLGMSTVNTSDRGAGSLVHSFFVALTNGHVIGGFALYGLSAILWLYVLARVQLSVAYPFVGLGFVITAAFGVIFFGESAHMAKLLGIALIITGVYLVGR